MIEEGRWLMPYAFFAEIKRRSFFNFPLCVQLRGLQKPLMQYLFNHGYCAMPYSLIMFFIEKEHAIV